MKSYTHNNQRASLWLLSLLFLCFPVFFTACDDVEDVYITDTQLSLLQESRSNLDYLLKNSTYGTAPGTFPESGKELLNQAISELDALIEKVKRGEELEESALEAAIAKANQAIDQFKASKYYELSPEAEQYINDLLEKADELRLLVANDSKWGKHKDQYPIENKSLLEDAATALETMAENIRSGAISNMTQDMYDDAIAAANNALNQVEASAWPDNSQVTWNLLVEGNKGTYIDFGYHEEFVKFGEDDHQSFTIELWVNIVERSRDDNSTFLSTIVYPNDGQEWSGWCSQFRIWDNRFRTMVGHWENEGPRDPSLWEPASFKSNWQGTWTHYAFLFSDTGLPGFDTPTDVKCYSLVDGSVRNEIIRVGEKWRTYLNHRSIENQTPMTGFCRQNPNGSREEFFTGSIKKIRIWRINRTEEQINRTYMGYEEGVSADNPDLVEAWDFEVKGDEPESNNEIVGLKGHVARLMGDDWRWVESVELEK